MEDDPDGHLMSGVSQGVVQARGIVKSFGGVRAIVHADISLNRGEVHALLGENGAGKSTLVNVLAGIVRPDSGEILVRGEQVSVPSPRSARDLGIAVVHQHPVLFPELSVAENIMFADRRARNRLRLLDGKGIHAQAVAAMARLDISLDPRRLVKSLSSAEQQMLEIVKALSEETDLLILDEPTSALSKREVGFLMDVIQRLKHAGVAILFVGHRLDEVFALADQVTVARDGRTIVTGPISDFTPESAVRHMVGKTLDSVFPKVDVPLGEVRLEVRNLTRLGSYENVNLSIRTGEILGLAGLVGAGRTEIARGIFGIDPVDEGEIIIDNSPVRVRQPQDAMQHGMAYVPEDRTREGVILDQTVQFNSSLAMLNVLSRLGLINKRRDTDLAQRSINQLAIRTSGPDQLTSALSGGNQQKVVLGKWLATDPRILILDDPTRGVDVGAKAEVYRIVGEMAGRGICVLLISNELEELLAVADRVITFYRGRQVTEFDSRPFDAEAVLASMTGVVGHVA